MFNIVNSTVGTYTTSSSNNCSNSVNFVYIINRCRECNHAHTQTGGVGCYDIVGNSIAFVLCSCEEYVPIDNLEYLEYLITKKESL
jgi:hypothetical protein